MPPTGVIIGHSFVSGLYDHLQNKTHQHLHPVDVANQFRVADHVAELWLLGERGLRVLDTSFIPTTHITQIHPQFVIIDAGTNDLATGASPLSVASALLEVATTLINQHHTLHVTLCSILHRANNIKMTPFQFQELANTHNNILKDLCEVEPDITYHTHRGFWNIPISQWSRDGIHPNTQLGRQKYKTSLRTAVYNAKKYFS